MCWARIMAGVLLVCRFGTFLCNCDKERHGLSLYARSPSLWAHLMADKDVLTNQEYEMNRQVCMCVCTCAHRYLHMSVLLVHSVMNTPPQPPPQPIFPTSNQRHLKLWEEYFLRHDSSSLTSHSWRRDVDPRDRQSAVAVVSLSLQCRDVGWDQQNSC